MLGLFRVFSSHSKTSVVAVNNGEQTVLAVAEDTSIVVQEATVPATKSDEEPKPAEQSSEVASSAPEQVAQPVSPVASVDDDHFQRRKRRISLRPFGRPRVHEEHKSTLSAIDEHEKKEEAHQALTKRLVISSSSDKKAKESALAVRAFIIGQPATPSPKVSKVNAKSKPQLGKLKSQLMKPKTANKVIAHLRELSADGQGYQFQARSDTPIHAVCLEHTDSEEHELHFSSLPGPDQKRSPEPSLFPASASVDRLSDMLNDMNIVDLIRSPDFGLGQPGDGPGILAGAVPTAETVINGIQQITPQLLALGYATGKAITPDHSGIHPPTDRMSVLTYWWGLEIALPPPSLAYLANAQSVSNAVVNFLTAVSMVNNGVREILPFVRYISQFVDFEFNAIKAQNKGNGVVCAATWLMPAALVPRPWDFPPSATTIGKVNDGTASDNKDTVEVPDLGRIEDGASDPPISALPVNALPPSLPLPSSGELPDMHVFTKT